MEKYELAVVVSNDNKNVTAIETIDAIKKAGFKNVFIQWYNYDWTPTQEEQLRYVRECGLNIIFAHLGYQNINDLWIEEETGIVERYKNDIRICKENDISMVIIHITSGRTAPKYSKIGIKRIKEICDYAKSLNIKVAFENNKIKDYLDYIIENIDSDNVGICFDSGHYHAFFNDEFDFEKFKNRIFAVHLHDNDKSDDLHLIPFDGTLDWDNVIKNLKISNYSGPITMEFCYRYDYLNMSLDEFYKKGYDAGIRLKEKFEKE